MLSKLFEITSAIVGETIHQTASIGEAIIDDIKDIPDAIVKGYDEGLFNSSESTEQQPQSKPENIFNSSVASA